MGEENPNTRDGERAVSNKIVGMDRKTKKSNTDSLIPAPQHSENNGSRMH